MLTIETKADFEAEKEYCFHVLFREMLGVDYRVVWKQQPDYTVLLPDGNRLVIEDHFFSALPESGYLNTGCLPKGAPGFSCYGPDIVSLYGTPELQDSMEKERRTIRCGSDLFAAAFFMLTRWEEWVVPDRDEHGRFPASASASFQFGFLDRPVVHEWADALYAMLQQLGWQHDRPERRFHLAVSCDVDHPRLWWSVLDRFKTLGGSLFVRGNIKETCYWLRHHFFRSRDPYDVFEVWMDLLRQHGLQAQFNFLGDRMRNSDCYYPVRHPFVRETIEKLANGGHGIGFHPSYESFDHPPLFRKELDSVREISPVPVTTGRQHYLRFAVPDTWKIWEQAGMHWDSTAGYSEAEGFRCGMCHDFPVFDVRERKMATLREKPLIAMDVTLALYQKYTPEQALERLRFLKKQVEKHRGEFVFLWHNSSWNTYFWEPWKQVFLKFLSESQFETGYQQTG